MHDSSQLTFSLHWATLTIYSGCKQCATLHACCAATIVVWNSVSSCHDLMSAGHHSVQWSIWVLSLELINLMSYFDGLLQFIAIGRHNDCKQFAPLHACYSCALSTNASNIIMDPMFLTSGHTHEGCSELSGGSTMAVCCFAGLHACYVSSTVAWKVFRIHEAYIYGLQYAY